MRKGLPIERRPKTTKATPGKDRSLVRQRLASVAGLIAEAGRIYREMRDGKLDHDKQSVWVLSQMRAMVEAEAIERLEQRLDELSQQGGSHGHTGADRSARLAH